MPAGKIYKYPRKKRKKKYNKSLALRVKKLEQNIEFKEHNVLFPNTGIVDAAGNVSQLTNISQGDTTQTRDGNQVRIVSLFLSAILRINTNAAETVLRFMIIQDKQTNQAQYNTGDVLLDATSIDSIISPLSLNNARRFKILYDKRFTFSIVGDTTVHFFQVYKKLNIMVRYDASTPAITDLTQNSLSVLMISDQVTNDPTCHFHCRLRFADS